MGPSCTTRSPGRDAPGARRRAGDRAGRGGHREPVATTGTSRAHHGHRPGGHARRASRRRGGEDRRPHKQHHRRPREQRPQRRPAGSGEACPSAPPCASRHRRRRTRLGEDPAVAAAAQAQPAPASAKSTRCAAISPPAAARRPPPARGEQGEGGIGGQPVVRQPERQDREEGQQPTAHSASATHGISAGSRQARRARAPTPSPPRARSRESPDAGRGEELERGERHVLVGEHRRMRATLSRWLSTTVYQRNPGSAQAASAYHPTPMTTMTARPERRQPRAHGPQPPRQRERHCEAASGPASPSGSLASAAIPSAAQPSTAPAREPRRSPPPAEDTPAKPHCMHARNKVSGRT